MRQHPDSQRARTRPRCSMPRARPRLELRGGGLELRGGGQAMQQSSACAVAGSTNSRRSPDATCSRIAVREGSDVRCRPRDMARGDEAAGGPSRWGQPLDERRAMLAQPWRSTGGFEPVQNGRVSLCFCACTRSSLVALLLGKKVLRTKLLRLQVPRDDHVLTPTSLFRHEPTCAALSGPCPPHVAARPRG